MHGCQDDGILLARIKPHPSSDSAQAISDMALDWGTQEQTPRGSTDGDGHDAAAALAERANEPQNFTIRSLLVGSAIGIVIAFSNTYFGLQTGWISGMAMPSALLGFAWFKATTRLLSFPFTPVENVLVQTVASSVGTMPLGCGFVGVIPALEFLLKPSETPDGSHGLDLPISKLIVWALGICFFGVVFAVPLRREVIIREKLKFPSGTATALMIGVLHGDSENKDLSRVNSSAKNKKLDRAEQNSDEGERLLATSHSSDLHVPESRSSQDQALVEGDATDFKDWKAKIRLLVISFSGSALYTVVSYSTLR